MESVPPPRVLTPLETLDAVAQGMFEPDYDDKTFTCKKCLKCCGGLLQSQAKLTHTAEEHIRSIRHQQSLKQPSLHDYGYQCVTATQAQQAARPAHKTPDPTHWCHGFWRPTVTWSTKEYNAKLLINDDKRGDEWAQERFSKIEFKGGKPVNV